MTERKASRYGHSVVSRLPSVILPTIPFGLAAGYAIGNYVASFVTGLVMASLIQVFTELDLAFVHPRLKGLPLKWREVVEMSIGFLYYTAGVAVGLLVCSRIFDLSVQGATAWAFAGLAFTGFLLVHVGFYFLHMHRAFKEKVIEEEQLQVLAAQAELKALKAQINPHFLFNTLNTIAALIPADPAQAEAMVERLAEMFRHVLAATEGGLMPLREELTFVDSYLEIEQARFGERLRVTREIAREALDVPVPSLILQPLVENAIQHGRAPDGSVDLTIRVQRYGDAVEIAIADRGPGMSERHSIGEGPGHGLRNVDERLRRTYGRGLEISAGQPSGTVVAVRVPV